MKRAIDFLETTHTAEIKAGGVWWRVERVTNAAADARRAMITLMVHPRSPAEVAEEQDIQAIEDAEDRNQRMVALRITRSRRWLEDEANRTTLDANRAELVRLGVTHVAPPIGPDGTAGEWEPCTLVETAEEADAAAGRVWQGRLNGPTRDALFAAIWDLCTDGGAADRRMERFLDGG